MILYSSIFRSLIRMNNIFPGPFTVFAPTDEAFGKLPDGTLDNLLANPDMLKIVLQYHVLSGIVPSNMIVDGMVVETLLPKHSLMLDFFNDMVRIDEMAMVTSADIEASNGLIHVIDSVLMPMKEQEPESEPKSHSEKEYIESEAESKPEPELNPNLRARLNLNPNLRARLNLNPNLRAKLNLNQRARLNLNQRARLNPNPNQKAKLNLKKRVNQKKTCLWRTRKTCLPT